MDEGKRDKRKGRHEGRIGRVDAGTVPTNYGMKDFLEAFGRGKMARIVVIAL